MDLQKKKRRSSVVPDCFASGMTRTDIDAAIAALAATQDWVFSRSQVLAVGATAAMVKRRIASGAWVIRGDGLYSARGAVLTWRARLFLAVLAPGGPAVVSYEAAAALHGLPTFAPGPVSVTVRHSTSRLQQLATVHQSRRLYDEHVTAVEGVPATTVARTIIDLAAAYRRGRIEILLDHAIATRKLTIVDFCSTFDDLACRGRQGIGVVRALLAERQPGYTPPASVAESLLLRVLRLGGLPRPVLQFPHPAPEYEGRRVDAAYPQARVLIEVDSRTWHGGWRAGERDRARDLAASGMRWLTLRVAYQELVERPDWVIEKVRGALAGQHAA